VDPERGYPFGDRFPWGPDLDAPAAEAAELEPGYYWMTGDAATLGIAPLPDEGWIGPITEADDGSEDDTTTRITASAPGTQISVLHVSESPFEISFWRTQCKWNGAGSRLIYDWDGADWEDKQAQPTTPSVHAGYTDGPLDSSLFNITPISTKYHLFVGTTTGTVGGNFSLSDSRIG
jgi:hypothetical protein